MLIVPSQCGVPLMLDRIKQSMVSCRVSGFVLLLLQCADLSLQEASIFFKKRAQLEEDYGRGMQKLAKLTSETYAMNDGKAG